MRFKLLTAAALAGLVSVSVCYADDMQMSEDNSGASAVNGMQPSSDNPMMQSQAGDPSAMPMDSTPNQSNVGSMAANAANAANPAAANPMSGDSNGNDDMSADTATGDDDY